MEKNLDDYLGEIEKYLKPLPVSERIDIVKEIQSEMLELQGDGKTAEEIIERLGNPRDLAKAYLGDVITKNHFFSWKRVFALCAYYSLAGLSGMIIIPVLIICAPVFILCGIATLILGAIKLADTWLNVPYADYIVISGVENPVIAFVICIISGAALYLIGRGCWKLLVYYINAVGKTKQRLLP